MSDCLFCRIAGKEISAKVEYEDPKVIAIHDINPQAPVHLLVIPKRHMARIAELGPEDASFIGEVIVTAKEIARKKGWSDYRLVFNNGPESGQSVYHIHLHLLSGRRMQWPPG